MVGLPRPPQFPQEQARPAQHQQCHRRRFRHDRDGSVDDVRESIDSVGNVIKWIEEVRDGSTKFIASLDEADFHKVPPTADGLSIGHWIFITVGHGAIHIGKIQLLRNMLQGDRDNPC